MTEGSTPLRVVLHLGAPKSGTTFLQRSLWARRAELAQIGIRPVGERARDMFHAAIEVRGTHGFWGLDADELDGTWRRLCADALTGVLPVTMQEGDQPPWPPTGTVVMSHELLAAATAEQARAALEPLEGAEVHLVYTARDLGRQVPSEWQERVKNGSTVTFAQFQQSLGRRFSSSKPSENLFWRAHDVIDVMDRWAGSIPPERVHVVPAPAPGSPPEELWRRFGEAVGFDGSVIGPQTVKPRSNETLGAVQVGLLRHVNEVLDGRIPQPGYAKFVKRYFSQGTLTQQRSDRPQCSPQLLEELITLAKGHVEEIRLRGYRLHGEPDELLPGSPDGELIDPDALPPEQLAAAATEAIADLLLERVPSQSPAPPPSGTPPAPEPVRLSPRARLGQGLRRVRGRIRSQSDPTPPQAGA